MTKKLIARFDRALEIVAAAAVVGLVGFGSIQALAPALGLA